LIAVVVLAIGLLGVAALQAQSMRYNHQAYVRSQAVQLAYDMSDRMRANDSMVDANGNTTTAASGVTNGTYNTGTAANKDCAKTPSNTVADCSVTDLALDDLNYWNAALAATLPDGAGTVCLDSTPGTVACDGSGNYYIKGSWTELQDGSGNTINFSLEYQ